MSKFFNETRSLKGASSAPATANVDIQELVGSLKQSMSANGGTAANPLPGLTAADYGPGASIASQYGLGA